MIYFMINWNVNLNVDVIIAGGTYTEKNFDSLLESYRELSKTTLDYSHGLLSITPSQNSHLNSTLLPLKTPHHSPCPSLLSPKLSLKLSITLPKTLPKTLHYSHQLLSLKLFITLPIKSPSYSPLIFPWNSPDSLRSLSIKKLLQTIYI